MPNNNYLRGRRREWEEVQRLKAEGYVSCRTAGSHSPVDVIGIDPRLLGLESKFTDEPLVIFVQLKSHKGASHRKEYPVCITSGVHTMFQWVEYVKQPRRNRPSGVPSPRHDNRHR